MMKGKILAVCLSDTKGVKKTDRGAGRLVEEHGFQGDAHAGDWHRQVSLLSLSSIEKMQAQGLDVEPGSFAENLTLDGFDVYELPVGSLLRVGEDALLEVTQIGKECHDRCAIYHQAGDCVMPREGIFARVKRGGIVKNQDDVFVVTPEGE